MDIQPLINALNTTVIEDVYWAMHNIVFAKNQKTTKCFELSHNDSTIVALPHKDQKSFRVLLITPDTSYDFTLSQTQVTSLYNHYSAQFRNSFRPSVDTKYVPYDVQQFPTN